MGSTSVPYFEKSLAEDALRAFLRSWRERFVEALQPKFLSEGWSLDTGFLSDQDLGCRIQGLGSGV